MIALCRLPLVMNKSVAAHCMSVLFEHELSYTVTKLEVHRLVVKYCMHFATDFLSFCIFYPYAQRKSKQIATGGKLLK